jgi:hypothetical protein
VEEKESGEVTETVGTSQQPVTAEKAPECPVTAYPDQFVEPHPILSIEVLTGVRDGAGIIGSCWISGGAAAATPGTAATPDAVTSPSTPAAASHRGQLLTETGSGQT